MARRRILIPCEITLRGLRVRADRRVPRAFHGRTFDWLDVTFAPTAAGGLRLWTESGEPLSHEGCEVRASLAPNSAAPRAQWRAIRGSLKEGDFHLARSIGRGRVFTDRYGGLAIFLPLIVLAGILIIALGRPGALVPLGVMLALVLLGATPALHLLRRTPVRFVLDAAGIRAAFDGGAEFTGCWRDLRALRLRGPVWRLEFNDGGVLELLALPEVGAALQLIDERVGPAGVRARREREARGWTVGQRLAAICVTLGLAGGAAIYVVFTRAMMPKAAIAALGFAFSWAMLPAAFRLQLWANRRIQARLAASRRRRAAAAGAPKSSESHV